jgi:anti-sigma factor RsiW
MKPDSARVLLHAYIDGELDAESATALEAEIDTSPDLKQELERLAALRSAVQSHGTRFCAPAALLDRLFESRAGAQPSSRAAQVPAWWRTLALGASMTAAALLIWSLGKDFAGRDSSAPLVTEAVSAHMRSLMGDHLTDLASSERHSLKPWLSNRLPFAPPVRSFSDQGFHLVGGRLEYLADKPSAAIVYRHREHVINVFVAPSDQPNSAVQMSAERGFNTARFDSAAMSYWVVSDLNPTDLAKLTDLLRSPAQ